MLENIQKIAIQAGEIVMKYFNEGFDIDYKAHNDPVTTADLQADKFIREEIHKLFPEDGILSEETEKEFITTNNRIRIIDPIDGTKNFVKKQDGFCVMIGLCEDYIPVFGVIYFPLSQKLYFAEKGKGAFLTENGITKQIHGNTKTKLEKTNIAFSSFYQQDFFPDIAEEYPGKHFFASGAGSKFCALAEGKIDISGCRHNKSSKRDVCAPQIILQEAGCKITDKNGDPIDFAQDGTKIATGYIAASNPQLHENFMVFLRKYT